MMLRIAVALLLLRVPAVHAMGAFQAQGDSLEQHPAHLVVRQQTLEVALRRLSERSGVGIAFSPDLVAPYARVSCACDRVTVGQALDSLLAGTTLRHVETGNRILVVPADQGRDSSSPPRPERGLLVGRVAGASDSVAIPHALITVRGRLGAVRAGADGWFRMVLPAGRYDLTVRALGYAPANLTDVAVSPGGADTIAVFLIPVAIELRALVVSPSTYGVQREGVPTAPQVLTGHEMQERPHGGEDMYRALNRFPGIATDDVSAKLHIRGAASDQVLQRLDGIELFEPYHLKDSDGVLSILDVESIRDATLMTGGFPVEYGNKLAGVIDMRTITPRPDRTTTTLGLSLLNATANGQGGFAGGRGAWLASARRGYLDLVLNLTDATAPGVDLSPRYYDLFAKVQYQLGTRHLLAGRALYASDAFSIVEEDGTQLNSGYGSGYGWATWQAELSDALHVTTMGAVGRITKKRDGFDPESGTGQVRLSVRDTAQFSFAELKQDWSVALSPRIVTKWGADYRLGSADYDYLRWQRRIVPNLSDPSGPSFYQAIDTVAAQASPRGSELGAYLAVRVRPVNALVVETGLRGDWESHTGDGTVGPRASFALTVAPHTTVRGAWGYYYQAQRINELQTVDGDTTFYPPERAEHRLLAVEHRLPDGTLVRMEGYDREIAHPRPEYRSIEPRYETLPEESADDRFRVAPARGRARGVELYVKHDVDGRLAWSASYALAAAEDQIGAQWVARPYDQTHTVHLELAFRPSEAWSLAAAWQYHTGWPATPLSFMVGTTITGDVYASRTAGPLNAERVPAYHRLDIRISRSFRVWSGRLSAYIDAYNVYDRKNAKSYDYTVRGIAGSQVLSVRGYNRMIGIIPSVGVRWQL